MKKLHLLGKTFGRLTAIAENGMVKGLSTWICKCECGCITKPIVGRRLTSSRTKSCKKCSDFDRRIVKSNKFFHCHYCKTIKSIEERISAGPKRPVGYAGRCRDCNRKRNYLSSRTIHGRYMHLKKSAKDRVLELSITEQQYEIIVQLDKCTYCNDPLNKAGHGLDRINNKLG